MIDPQAELAGDVEVGPGTVIEAGAKISAGCKIGPHVVISGNTTIGRDCVLFPGAVVGLVPQDLKFHGENSRTIIGDRTVIREYASIHRGTEARGETVLGSDCLIMAYSHIAHDCYLGDHVIVSNTAQLAGHIDVGDWAIIGGVTAVQQFVRIGAHAYVGGMCRIVKDVPPYVLVADVPSYVIGINVEGLRRRGFSSEDRNELRYAYQIVYRQGLILCESIELLRTKYPVSKNVKVLVDFLSGAQKGIMPGQKKQRTAEEDLLSI